MTRSRTRLSRSSRTVFTVLVVALIASAVAVAGGPGFRSERKLEEHYAKHGNEFGNITRPQYLQMAQRLRDTPADHNVLECRRPDGGVAKFDRKHGYFVAYDADRTIRTFFIPADGERYFERQARRYAQPH